MMKGICEGMSAVLYSTHQDASTLGKQFHLEKQDHLLYKLLAFWLKVNQLHLPTLLLPLSIRWWVVIHSHSPGSIGGLGRLGHAYQPI